MKLGILIFVALTMQALTLASQAQKQAPQKFNDAIKRSESAAEVITKLAQLSQNNIPKELVDKAEAIGVFPCKKTDLLIEHAVLCPGVISRHLQNGWSSPAFYRFGGGGFGRPDPALRQSAAMILLFMDKESVEWLDKAIALKGEKQAQAGPVGSITKEQRIELANAHILAYADGKDGLRGQNLRSGSWKAIGLGQDNNINQGLYGIKGREILAGKVISAASIPSGISAFQQALERYYSR
jgi:lipid-binding SYLF domain-containing protein